jgi:hypothetical protein
MFENTVGAIQDFLAVPNKLISTVVGSFPQFTIVVEVASKTFLMNSIFKICR